MVYSELIIYKIQQLSRDNWIHASLLGCCVYLSSLVIKDYWHIPNADFVNAATMTTFCLYIYEKYMGKRRKK
jgi:hypothetical protein